MVFQQFFRGATNVAARLYQRSLAKNLKEYGLKYEDLLIETPAVERALSRIPAEVRIERERRIKRAIDASAKKKTLPEELQNYDPFESYLREHVEIAKLEETEKVLLKDH
eukprot:gene4590-4920_t